MPDQTGPSAKQILIDWTNAQDGWVRAMVGQVLNTRRPLTDDDLEAIYGVCLAEKGLVEESPPSVAALTLGEAAEEQLDTLRIRSLSDLKNVNALAAGQGIAFNDRVTVLFGENAAGKTGYVRVLKRLAAVRSQEDVLPNLTGPPVTQPPEAKIAYVLGDSSHDLYWKNEQGVRPFNRLNVFDSKATLIHVDADLTYVFTPGDLALFRASHDGIEGVRLRLDTARSNKAPQGNPFLSRFARGTSIYTRIETLGASSDLAELEELARVSDEEERELQPLRDKVEALKPQAGQARLRVARDDRTLYGSIVAAADAVASFDWDAYHKDLENVRTAEKRHREANEEAFAGGGIPEVLSDPWRAFVQAGEEYLRHIARTDYPHDGDQCVYCRQPLAAEAIELLRKYREFSTNTLRQELDQARRALGQRVSALLRLDPARLREVLDRRSAANGAEGDAPPILEKALPFVDQLSATLESLQRGEAVEPTQLRVLGAAVSEDGAPALAQADELIAGLTKEGEERERLLAEARAKLSDLESRLTLRTHLPEIKTHVGAAKWADRVSRVLGRFTVLLRTLTEASKLASERLLNQDFERLFAEECKALRAPPVRLDFPGRGGEAKRRKTLAAGHALSDVLSEGEQKAIALADFLAEASLPKAAGPIVFDDPVTSLDHKRLRYVVDRIVDLSASRQAIVFTHNIWFAVELLARFEGSPTECSFYEVASEDGVIGLVESRPHPKWDTPGKIAPNVTRLIASAQGETGVARDDLIRAAYSHIRSWCEAVVEQELLAGVTTRYQPHVRMTALPRIRADRLESAIQDLLPIFEKACRITEAHSQPLETLGIRPTLEELKGDWGTLQKAREAYRKG